MNRRAELNLKLSSEKLTWGLLEGGPNGRAKWRSIVIAFLVRICTGLAWKIAPGITSRRHGTFIRVFFVSNGERLRHCFACSQGANDCQDLTIWGQHAELLYECLICGNHVFHLLFCFNCWDGPADLLYCDSCHGSSNLFGCVGMRKRKFCVLNKQYSEPEYQTLASRIVQHMQKTGEWGEFFPAALSHSPYNCSLAYRYFPQTKVEVSAEGLWWLDSPSIASTAVSAVPAGALPDNLPDNDTSLVALSSLSGRPYKITSEEIRRYREFVAPLPRLTYDERMNDRMHRAGGLKLFERTCARSGKAILSCYSPAAPYPVIDREVLERELLS